MRSNMNAPIAFLAAFVAYSCSQLSSGGQRLGPEDLLLCFLPISEARDGRPPPSIAALVVVTIAGAAVIFVRAWWFDRHRHVERD